MRKHNIIMLKNRDAIKQLYPDTHVIAGFMQGNKVKNNYEKDVFNREIGYMINIDN